nr:helitron helicase-like domain-containing protein [Tanacetum cinerariifolium]
MKIKNKPSKRKSIDDSSMECREKGISKKPRATFPLAMSNTNKPVINNTCLQQKGDPIDKAVGTNIGLSVGNTIAKGTPLPKDLLIKCDKREMIYNNTYHQTPQLSKAEAKTSCSSNWDEAETSWIPLEYNHLGQCTCVCRHCGAMFWECKKVTSTSHTSQFGYNKCCYGGRIILRPPPEYPQYIKELYENAHFMDNIRAYNQMFSKTSLGANVDKSINNGKGPYVFRISSQLYHWIGSLCPEEGQSPRFLQLYIYDTTNEVKNRLSHFNDEHQPELKKEIVKGLIEFLDNHNVLVQLFWTAHNKHIDADIPEFKVRLYNVIGTCQYELPTSETIGAIVFADSSTTENEFDLIIKEYSQFPQRVSKLHPCYMSLQFPSLFVYVCSYCNCAIEQSRLDYIRQKQDDIRSEYLSGSLRYMYAHYLDALAICRLTVADRADIVDRVFEKKVRDYIAFVRDSKTFGTLVGARCNAQKLIFVYGHGGTGKTFLWKAVTSALRSEEKIFLTVAASGDPDETDTKNMFVVHIPPELCIPDSDAALAGFIEFIYDEKTLQTPTPKDLQKKAIVCPKNEDADMINAEILRLVNHQQHVYLSFDEAVPHGNDGGETKLLYPTEYLNSLNFAGFPPHRLELKVEANDPNIIPTDKGKLPSVEANSVSIADINPTLLNQTN